MAVYDSVGAMMNTTENMEHLVINTRHDDDVMQFVGADWFSFNGTPISNIFPESVKPDCFKMFEPRMKSSASGIFSYMIFCTHLVQIQALELLIKILRLSAL